MKKVIAWAIVGLSAAGAMCLSYRLMCEAENMVGLDAGLVRITAGIVLMAAVIIAWALHEISK